MDLSTNSFAWTGSLKITVKSEKYTVIQAFLNYNSLVTLPQFKLGQICYIDLSIKRTFLHNKLTEVWWLPTFLMQAMEHKIQ